MTTTTSVLDNLTSSYTSTSGTDRLAANKNTFLTLLVAQLTHQDPLNPAEDTEFISQLAQFSSLEQLQGINESIGGLSTTMNQSMMLSATSFIGKDILAAGNQITKVADTDGTVYTTDLVFTVDSAIQQGQINIFDSNGTLVYSGAISGRNAGTYTFQWDGANTSGKTVADGIYTAAVSCQDADGRSVLASTQCVGSVVGVENIKGTYNLILTGGRTVNFMDVTEVYQSAANTGASAKTDASAKTGAGSNTDADADASAGDTESETI
jgi:flagellar basal-body rod modification protein FlgD